MLVSLTPNQLEDIIGALKICKKASWIAPIDNELIEMLEGRRDR